MAKLLDWRPPEGCRMFDTLIVGRLMHPDRTQLPAGLGGQSLREWGWYLGNRKADYDGGWEQYSQEMLDYCVQDVATNVTIYKHQLKWAADNMKLINFEQRVAAICHEMASTGWGFDIDAARAYEQELVTSRAGLEDQLREAFPTIITERWSEKTGKRLKDGVEVFNPGSSKQWASRLGAKYKWKTEFTDAGAPIVDEPALRAAGFPETELGLEWRDINKKLGMLSDWILRADDGMIYGRTNSQGTATGRASHSQPNLAQVPSDPGCRVLFGPANREWAMVGCDLSGIELRCLAHYMAPFDDGAYAREILEGDIHTANQQAAGLPTRDDAKTFIYALIYGAGDGKLGSIVDGSAKVGKGLRGRFFAAIPALATLIEKAQFKAQKAGELKLLDG
ncbi:MAG: hypothetical protein GY911_02825, partial [Actinomycetales bacterium]|nr:hypothetical protein [Actinomycetales bacterium]